MAAALPTASPYVQWQYVAKDATSIWSAPMAVQSLYSAYTSPTANPATQPFAVDVNAENFALNVANSASPTPNPVRPFAELTFLTPCVAESDHPNPSTVADGPQWLAYVLNAIGQSAYWPNTAIIVTWDDWGGWYDNYTPSPWPWHPGNNFYNNPNDPNEWGFRVPLIVISPWIKSRGYISTGLRSQGTILNFIEDAFGLGTNALNGDDLANGSDDLSDMFDFNRTTPGCRGSTCRRRSDPCTPCRRPARTQRTSMDQAARRSAPPSRFPL